MKRIVLHWTGGGPNPNAQDRQAYHAIVSQDCQRHMGDLAPEANLNISDGIYARHAGGFNTGAIGIALCGMAGARERPFSPGIHPINMAQFEEACKWSAEMCVIYKIPVTINTVLIHSEVLPRFRAGIYKWDVNWLPGMKETASAFEMGDLYRVTVCRYLPQEPKRGKSLFNLFTRR